MPRSGPDDASAASPTVLRNSVPPAELPSTPPPQAVHGLVYLPPNWLPLALLIGDALIACLSVSLAYWYRFHLDRIPRIRSETPAFGWYLGASPVVAALFLVGLALNNQYRSWRGRALVDQVFAQLSGAALSAMLILAAMSLYRGFEFSRLTFVYTVVMATALMIVERYFLRQYETRLRRRGIGTERVLVVGTGTGSKLLIQRMTMFPQYGFQVAGVADDDLAVGAVFAGAQVVGKTEQLPRLLRELRVNQVFVALAGPKRDERLLHLIKICDDQQVEFKVIPDLFDVMSSQVAAEVVDGLPLIGVRRSRLRGTALILKRAIDLIATGLGLLVLSPLLLLLALLIKITSPGPVLFKQERVGLGGRPFTLYKFRTMVLDAEANTGPVFAVRGDDRVTLFGRILRRLSLDELPQLYNVLRGEMSLVGPRPERAFFVERFQGEVPRYLERHQVRPGVTGWAQVNDLRGATSVDERTIYDIYYVENWSLALDLKILLLTVGRLLFHRHAY